MLISKPLDDKILVRLGKIFREKQWQMENKEYGDISVFDRFCARLAELDNDDDRDFMLELTEKYLTIEMGDYERLLLKVFHFFQEAQREKVEGLAAIYIFPVQDMENYQKTKSGNFMCYMIQGIAMRCFELFHNKRVRIIETFEGVKKQKESIDYLILLDDYIGSGDTALACMNLLAECGIQKEKMCVLSIVAQQQGIEAIQEYGVDIYSAIEKNRGITDAYPKEIVPKKLAQMKRISKRIKANKELYLGYKDSEALVSMMKTPNNTFPFYWYEQSKKGKVITYAPFPRRGNVGVDEYNMEE